MSRKPTSPMVERIAVAVWTWAGAVSAPAWGKLDTDIQAHYLGLAEAVLHAMATPTPEMLAAGALAEEDARRVWSAMIRAAMEATP
jgi:hypothetical protein